MSVTLALENEELHKQFFALQTPRDIARLLDIEYNRLVYHLYKVPPSKQYTTFQIPKKSGGVREISTPATALKIMQRKLNQVLQCVYAPKAPVRGFVHSQSVVTNARTHSGRKYVFNIDLRDFFPSPGLPYIGLFCPELYGLGNAHFDQFTRVRCDPPLIKALTGHDRVLLNLGIGKGLERNHDAVRRFAVEAILIEEQAPQRQGRRIPIDGTEEAIPCP